MNHQVNDLDNVHHKVSKTFINAKSLIYTNFYTIENSFLSQFKSQQYIVGWVVFFLHDTHTVSLPVQSIADTGVAYTRTTALLVEPAVASRSHGLTGFLAFPQRVTLGHKSHCAVQVRPIGILCYFWSFVWNTIDQYMYLHFYI